MQKCICIVNHENAYLRFRCYAWGTKKPAGAGEEGQLRGDRRNKTPPGEGGASASLERGAIPYRRR